MTLCGASEQLFTYFGKMKLGNVLVRSYGVVNRMEMDSFLPVRKAASCVHNGQGFSHRLKRKGAVILLNGTVKGRLNVPLFYETLSRILSEKYGAKITVTAWKKGHTPDTKKSAVTRLQEASKMSLQVYQQPLIVTTSGGKDSSVCVASVERAGIPFEVLHNHTTADAPETVYFIREEFQCRKQKG